jgi:outer membrane protein
MQAIAISLCAALGLAISVPVAAQTAVRIGFVNVNFVLQNAPQTAAVNDTLTAEFAPREADLVARQEAWTTKRDNYIRDAAVMAQAERTALESEIEDEGRALQREQTALQEDLEIRQTALVNELQATIARRIQAFAVAEGYDLILTNQGVVYASEAIDVTEAVLRAISSGSSTTEAAPEPSAPAE